MAELDPGVLAVLAVYLVIVYVHEWGHYAVGRWVVGIPASEITIVMTDFPQYVALRDGDAWLHPSDPRYDDVYQQYDPGHERADVSVFNAYVAGGVLGQAVGVVAIAAGLLVVGQGRVAELIVEISILFVAAYLLMDLANSFLAEGGGYTGDFSAHWNHSPVGTVLLVVVVATLHAPLYLGL